MLTLDQLPVGVTGFDRPASQPLLPVRRFKAACHHAARHAGGMVMSVTGCEGQVAINFHHAEVSLAGERVTVLCNYLYPYIAIVPLSQDGFCKRTFLPPGALGAAFGEMTDLQPLDPGFLETDLTPRLLEQLGHGELHELRYWQRCGMAERVGDVIFNNWD